LSLEEDIFEEYFQKLKDLGTSLELIDGVKRLWKNRKLTSTDELQALIDGEQANAIKDK